MFDYKNKVALITGGSNGIGLALAKELLQRGAKAVALVDIDDKNGLIAVEDIKAEFKRNDCVIFIKTDVSITEEIKNAFDIIVNTYQQLDILVNNAVSEHELNWEKTVAVNLTAVITGTILATKTYFPKHRIEPESLIINMSSAVALTSSPAFPVYGATKSGVASFTKSMGHESSYQHTKTRIIAFCPCTVDTASLMVNANLIPKQFFSEFMDSTTEEKILKLNDFINTLLDKAVSAQTGSIWSVTRKECKEVDYDRVLS